MKNPTPNSQSDQSAEEAMAESGIGTQVPPQQHHQLQQQQNPQQQRQQQNEDTVQYDCSVEIKNVTKEHLVSCLANCDGGGNGNDNKNNSGHNSNNNSSSNGFHRSFDNDGDGGKGKSSNSNDIGHMDDDHMDDDDDGDEDDSSCDSDDSDDSSSTFSSMMSDDGSDRSDESDISDGGDAFDSSDDIGGSLGKRRHKRRPQLHTKAGTNRNNGGVDIIEHLSRVDDVHPCNTKTNSATNNVNDAKHTKMSHMEVKITENSNTDTPANTGNTTNSSSITPVESYENEDDKARIIATLMKHHSDYVTLSLVERSNTIQSIIWLSRHVPGIVLDFMFKTIEREREFEIKEKERENEREKRMMKERKRERLKEVKQVETLTNCTNVSKDYVEKPSGHLHHSHLSQLSEQFGDTSIDDTDHFDIEVLTKPGVNIIRSDNNANDDHGDFDRTQFCKSVSDVSRISSDDHIERDDDQDDHGDNNDNSENNLEACHDACRHGQSQIPQQQQLQLHPPSHDIGEEVKVNTFEKIYKLKHSNSGNSSHNDLPQHLQLKQQQSHSPQHHPRPQSHLQSQSHPMFRHPIQSCSPLPPHLPPQPQKQSLYQQSPQSPHQTPLSPLEQSSILPIPSPHTSALLFVDMSGFTKISTMLDVESLSNAINSYFEMIVNEVVRYGGDILKFAGDAIFAEWKVPNLPHEPNVPGVSDENMNSDDNEGTSPSNPTPSTTSFQQSKDHCVALAATCAASIVSNCSDYPIYAKSKRMSMQSSLHSRKDSSTRNLGGAMGGLGGLRGSAVLRRHSNEGAFPFTDEGSEHACGSGGGGRGQFVGPEGLAGRHSSMRFQRRGSMGGGGELPRRGSMGDDGGGLGSSRHLNHPGGTGMGSSQHPNHSGGGAQRSGSMDTAPTTTILATLNVKCGIGVGDLVGIHVGNDESRREYLILGDPIDQVAAAEGAATHGEVFCSWEAVQCLKRVCTLEKEIEEKAPSSSEEPIKIASRQDQYFQHTAASTFSDVTPISEQLLYLCEDLEYKELLYLKRSISKYVHPVVVHDDTDQNITSNLPLKRESDHERHLAEAELRNVYVMFITPLIDAKLTGNKEKDDALFQLLNDVLNVTTRELDRVQGHLRQFIVDDKGVVLIGTFGLRGSTFPNMIAQRALPITLSIHEALQEELNVKNKVGATFGRAYCGVVGGRTRHEFAVLGPSVNLAARLMASQFNPGILVDRNVRLLTSQIFFKPLPPVKAKGYDDPVPIFQPLKGNDNRWGQVKRNFVGRSGEIKRIMFVAKEIAMRGSGSANAGNTSNFSGSMMSKFVFVSAVSGTGKSSLMVQATEHVRAMIKKMNKRVVVTRNISNDGDSRVPFSLFRSIFKDVLQQMKFEEDDLSFSRRGSTASRILSSESSLDFSIENQWDNLSLHSHSTSDTNMSTDANKFRMICKELDAPPEFVEIIGKRLLGLRETSTGSSSGGSAPNLTKIVEFLADAFIRCTKHASLVLLALDDVHLMDEMSWKVVQVIFERGKNVLILCGSRPPSSNPLSVDPTFWSDLTSEYQSQGRYFELCLNPLTELEVQEMISAILGYPIEEIDSSVLRNMYLTSGGMPHFLCYFLETVKRSGLLTALGNGLVGLKSSGGDGNKLDFGSVGELLLYRIDALDSSVRSALHLAAVLGTEFDLLDAALTYEEMFGFKDQERLRAAMALRVSFDVAVEEGIIEESFTGGEENECEEIIDEDGALCASLGNVMITLSGRKAHPFYDENRRYRFTHDSWKTSILNVMLDQRKRDLHEYVALTLEREAGLESKDDDFEKQIRLFKHWNACGNFIKSADLALKVGGELMLLGLNSQAILLFNDSLSILEEGTGGEDNEKRGGISLSVLESIEVPELERLIKLNVSKGKSCGTLGLSKDGAVAFQNALDVLHTAPCVANEEFDRSISFPIFSGLFVVLKMGAIEQDAECSYEKDLCSKFVEQARLNGDPVHYGRALAMEAETFGRLGNFDQAFESLAKIKSIYNIEEHHAAMCKSYGSDRAAQTFAHSLNWDRVLKRTDKAFETCNFILEHLLPRSDPKNIHNSFCLFYAPMVLMKENGLALKARDIFISYIMEPFEEHFGEGGSTFSKPLWKPIQILLNLQGNQEGNVKELEEYTEWASIDSNREVNRVQENGWKTFAVSPSILSAEMCYYLAKRQTDFDKKVLFIQSALRLAKMSVESTEGLRWANEYALEKFDVISSFAKDYDCLDS